MSERPSVGATVQGRGFFGGQDPVEVATRTLFVPSFANATAFETDAGVLLADCGVVLMGPDIHAKVRAFTDAPLDTVVYTHGHVDHTMGLQPWLEAGDDPRVVAHTAVPRRFERYRKMAGLNEHINTVQFGLKDVMWPREFNWPTTTYDDSLTLTLSGERFELRHGMGETDDATWIWAPERGVLCTGDFWISCVPNCGNPQKVQRYPEEWIEVFEQMIPLGAEVLAPGHGPVITGTDEVRQALTDAAEYLGIIVSQTLDLMNQGLEHDEIVQRVEVPSGFADRPYLQPVYDRPEFIVRNLIRLHWGWWDGYASHLMPATERRRAREIAELAGGVDRLVARARELAPDDLTLACHLAEWAALADPEDAAAQRCVIDLFTQRASDEPSLMGRGIYMHAVREAERLSGSGGG